MLKTFAVIFGAVCLSGLSYSKDSAEKKSVQAVRVSEAPKIDGVLNDPIWRDIPVATGFIQNAPNPGKDASQRTEVKVIYDNEALYIAATLYDISRDSIIRQYSQRDNEDNTDIFGVFIGPYNDDQTGYGFVVHPTGVQWDARYSQEQGQDVLWNAVWLSEVIIDDKNWYVEMKIPYSAIRFPDKEVHTWGVNFARKIRRKREFSLWNYVDPQVNGFVNQWGLLTGIENIEAPPRLSFSPYVSAYLEHFPDDDPNTSDFSSSFNGGLDLKYGLNDAFTLDMTLIPDFGQVVSDNLVLNLSPFEVQFNENRQFFMEGTELFNKGGLFYSRRIGGTPINYSKPYANLQENETVESNPSVSQLLNSFKVSGRTRSGLGIGVFNGITNEMNAVIRDTVSGATREVVTDPLSNYSVIVLDQNLRNNSYATLINTNVARNGSTYDANVTGGFLKLNTNNNMYSVEAEGVLSQKYFSDSTSLGHSTEFSLLKQGGNFTSGITYLERSDTYEPNDLGFLYNNNERSVFADASYRIYEPFWKFLSVWSSVNTMYQRLYAPSEFSNFVVSADLGATTRKWFTFGTFFNLEPVETYDFFEPRVWGRYYAYPTNYTIGGFISTDYRKKIALDFFPNFRKFNASGRYSVNFRLSPRIRFNDRFSTILQLNRYEAINDEGAAIFVTGGSAIDNGAIIFAKRDQLTYETVVDMSYIFTNRMGITLRGRHYWSEVTYNSFHVLDSLGGLAPSTYTGIDGEGNSYHNTNFNVFSIDLVYRWVFAPGSEMNIVYKSNLLSYDGEVAKSYFTNLNDVFNSPQRKSLSIKVLYYLDYLMLKRDKPKID